MMRRLVHKAALGDARALGLVLALDKQMGDILAPEEAQTGGVLVTPRPMSEEEWERLAAENQRKYREADPPETKNQDIPPSLGKKMDLRENPDD